MKEDQKVPEKYLQNSREDRTKRTAAQTAHEWKPLKITGSIPQRYFRCTCCGGIVEHSSTHLNKEPNGYEDLCSWCVNNAVAGWLVKEE